jgi:hypothetical protein
MLPSGVSVADAAVPPTCQPMIWLALPLDVASSAATTSPVDELSAVFAGTGVATRSPSAVRSGDSAVPKLEAWVGVQVVIAPAAGLSTTNTAAVSGGAFGSGFVESNWFAATISSPSSSPSFG